MKVIITLYFILNRNNNINETGAVSIGNAIVNLTRLNSLSLDFK